MQAVGSAILAIMFSVGAQAATVTVDWTPGGAEDTSPDGIATGVLQGTTVTLTATDDALPFGGSGQTLNRTNLASQPGQNLVPGIDDPGVDDSVAAIGWLAGTAGEAVLDLGGLAVTDPWLLFDSLDQGTTVFDFPDGTVLTLVDSNSGTVEFSAGSVVTASSKTYRNSLSDGFSLQLKGTYTQISFTTNAGGEQPENSVGFTLAVDDGAITSAVPLPPALALLLSGFGALALLRRAA